MLTEPNTAQDRFFDFHDMAPVGFCTTDDSGLILEVNLTFATQLGCVRSALPNQLIRQFVHPDDQAIYDSLRLSALSSHERQHGALRMTKQDGEPFWARLDAIVGFSGDGAQVVRIVVTDFTSWQVVKTELLLANQELAFQSNEKGKRAAELLIANEELAFQNNEKESRAAELLLANKELAFQIDEKGKRAIELSIANENIQHHLKELEDAFWRTVEVATILTEMRDPYTSGHERRVAEIAVAIGAELGFDARQQEGLRVAGYLHDIGKITVPAEILTKPGKLKSVEHLLIQGHAQAGHDVLKNVKFPWKIAEIVLQHHERKDGLGYPLGIKGDEISLEAGIIAVADVVEAMSSHRPYRAALGIDAALNELVRGRGTQFDALATDACLRLFRERGYSIPA